MFIRKMESVVFLMLLILLLAACGGGEAEATAVPDTPTLQPTNTATAVPPTETPIPPTPTPEPPTPTPTPDITANFNNFTDESEGVTFQYPPDWQLDTESQENGNFMFILTSGEDVFDLLGAEDYSQPLGFVFGEIRWVALYDSDDPSFLLADWTEESGLDMSPVGDVSLAERDGMQIASQEFEVVNNGNQVLLTAAVILNGGRYGALAYGTTAAGADEFGALTQAIFDSIEVHYLDPEAEPPSQTADAAPTPIPQFTGEMALVTNENGRFQMGRLNLATGLISDIVDRAANPAWRPRSNDLSFTSCEEELCQIRLTSRENALVSDDEVSFRYGSWSPDGRYLAFVANPDGVDDIYVYDFGVDPPELTRLTENSGYNSVPIWSSEGSVIIFASDRDGDYDIYVMGADGRNPTPVTNNDTLDFAPNLSPDGEKVVYVSDVNGVLELFIFDFVQDETRQITSNSARSNYSPTWSPDGRTIAYLALLDDGQYQITFISSDGGAPIPYPLLPSGPFFEIVWRPAPQEFAVEIVAVDFEDPASVLQAVFKSARLGDYSQLAGLCDPQKENDSDTAAICALTPDHEFAASFEEWFSTGRITGDAVIDGSRAEIPFTFGPESDREETMTLILRDGRWYLLEF